MGVMGFIQKDQSVTRLNRSEHVYLPLPRCHEIVGDGEACTRLKTQSLITLQSNMAQGTRALQDLRSHHCSRLLNNCFRESDTILDRQMFVEFLNIPGKNARYFVFCDNSPIDISSRPVSSLYLKLFQSALFF